jgi:RNA polymerase sigma-70 factor (ECF subfamily)
MRPREDLPEGDLLRRAARGDEEAFVLLYRRHQGAIYRYAMRMTGSMAAAEEITQEVFLALVRKPGRYDVGRGDLGAFLFGMARNLTRKHLERERAAIPIHGSPSNGWAQEPPDPLADVEAGVASNPAQLLAQQQTVERVRAAIHSLPEEYREVIVLCELEERSYEEAAKLLECAVGTVRSRLHRARALLLAKLEVLEGQPRRAAAR